MRITGLKFAEIFGTQMNTTTDVKYFRIISGTEFTGISLLQTRINKAYIPSELYGNNSIYAALRRCGLVFVVHHSHSS